MTDQQLHPDRYSIQTAASTLASGAVGMESREDRNLPARSSPVQLDVRSDGDCGRFAAVTFPNLRPLQTGQEAQRLRQHAASSSSSSSSPTSRHQVQFQAEEEERSNAREPLLRKQNLPAQVRSPPDRNGGARHVARSISTILSSLCPCRTPEISRDGLGRYLLPWSSRVMLMRSGT